MPIIKIYEETLAVATNAGYSLIYTTNNGWIRPFVAAVGLSSGSKSSAVNKLNKHIFELRELYPENFTPISWSSPKVLSFQEAYYLLILKDIPSYFKICYPHITRRFIGNQLFWVFSNNWRTHRSLYIPVQDPKKLVDGNLMTWTSIKQDILRAYKTCGNDLDKLLTQSLQLRALESFNNLLFSYPEIQEISDHTRIGEVAIGEATMKPKLGSFGMQAYHIASTVDNQPIMEIGIKPGFKPNYITLTNKEGSSHTQRDLVLFNVNNYIEFLNKHYS